MVYLCNVSSWDAGWELGWELGAEANGSTMVATPSAHILFQHPVWVPLVFFRWLSRWLRMPVGIQVVIALSTSWADRVFLRRSLLFVEVPHLPALKGKISGFFFSAFSHFALLLLSLKVPFIEVLHSPFQVVGLIWAFLLRLPLLNVLFYKQKCVVPYI